MPASYSYRDGDRHIVCRHDGERQILDRQSAPRAVDLYQDKVGQFRNPCRARLSSSKFFHLNPIAQHQSRRSHSRDRRQRCLMIPCANDLPNLTALVTSSIRRATRGCMRRIQSTSSVSCREKHRHPARDQPRLQRTWWPRPIPCRFDRSGPKASIRNETPKKRRGVAASHHRCHRPPRLARDGRGCVDGRHHQFRGRGHRPPGASQVIPFFGREGTTTPASR